MNDKDRKAIVSHRFKRANNTLLEVELLIENNMFNTAVNRLYYASFYAITALLVSPLRKLTYFIKLVILDEIFIFRNSVMPGHQLVEENKNIAKRNFFDCVSFRSGLISKE